MASTTTWRSPLSILMGARRNDDASLELREDYYHPHSQAAPKSPAAAATATANEATTAAAVDDADIERPKSGLSSYNPFSYFGLTSSVPATASDGQNGIGDSHENNNINQNQNQNGAPAPPMGAFPPPISESPADHNERGIAGDVDADDGDPQGDNRQFFPSHPWFNQLELTDSNHEHNLPNESNEPLEFDRSRAHERKKGFITWEDQKAIIGTTFNFTNSIIGAGAMGLGGAFAASGGGISVIMLLGFAYLTKLSLDLVVDLSSCPSVIRIVRLQESEHHRNDMKSDGSLSSDSESLNEESGSNKSSETDNSFENILGIARSPMKSAEDELLHLQALMPPKYDDENAKDTEATGDELLEKDENIDSSPLMADEEEKDGHNETGDGFQTPSKSAHLNLDHPLATSPEQLKQKDRMDSLTMDATTPRHFSPLAFKAEDIPFNAGDIPIAKSTPSIQNDTSLQQLQYSMSPCTYEELGYAAFGTAGRLAVLISKALYSFGCLIAYTVVVRDNFGLALRRIIIGPTSPNSLEGDEEHGLLYDDDFLAFWVSALVMLPLSCPRTMKPLAKFSFVSVVSIAFLVLAVVYMYFTCTNPESGATGKGSFYEDWIQIRSFSGLIESLGCFVFTFVCHHTVNLAYETLPQPIRTPKVWRRVSTNSIALALQSSLAIGVFAYLTFGSQTPADVLMGYPADLTLANVARLLLCLTMVLTFPLPFLTCREMSILIFVDMHTFYHVNGLERYNFFSHICADNNRRNRIRQTMTTERAVAENVGEEADFVHMQLPFFKRWKWTERGTAGNVGNNDEWWDDMNGVNPATEALLSEMEHETAIITSIGGQNGKQIHPSPLSSRSGDLSSSETTISTVVVPAPSWILDGGRQLILLWHSALTFTLWLIVTICAIKSPSLGDVLDLVGAATGTMLAFVLPALFSFKLKGVDALSVSILGIGGLVGLFGTVFSCVKFVKDTT